MEQREPSLNRVSYYNFLTMPSKKNGKSSTSNADDDINLKSIDDKLNTILNKLSTIDRRLDQLEKKQQDIENSVDFAHSEITDFKTKQSQLEAKVEQLEKKLESYNSLNARVVASENNARAKCLELNGIPPTKGENLMEGFLKITKHLNKKFINPILDIDSIYRIKQTKRVVIKFLHSYKRNQFFQTYKKNILNTCDIGFQESSKIYVNEVLSPEQNALLWRARNFKKTANYKYIWTFNQRIYLRKDSDSDAIQINTDSDLEDLGLVRDAN